MVEMFAWVPRGEAAEIGFAVTIGLAKLIAWGAMGCWAGLHAAYKGYPRILSLLLCTPFGPLSFVVVLLLQPVAEGRERAAEDQQIDEELAESQDDQGPSSLSTTVVSPSRR